MRFGAQLYYRNLTNYTTPSGSGFEGWVEDLPGDLA